MRAPIRLLAVGALAFALAAPLCAQDPLIIRPPDTLKTDTLKKADTLSTTDRLLKAQKDQQVHLQPLARCGVASLLPGGARVIFNRDSIDWAPARSISELLQRIPGVFLERSDWLGSPELLNYFGHGAASVQYDVDCVPMRPMGIDSVAFDPSAWPLDLVDRVEVETSPAMLHVMLFTRSHDRAAPRTKIGVSQGDRGSAQYSGLFEKRYVSGVGLGLGANYLVVNQPSGTARNTIATGWFQLGYNPSPRFGVQAQLVTNAVARPALVEAVTLDTLSRLAKGVRTDFQLRASLRQRDDGTGRSLDLFYAHTSWKSDSFPILRSRGGVGIVGALRHPTWSAQLKTWLYSRETLLDSRLQLGWSPSDILTGSLELSGQRHDGDRNSGWATARVGAKLPLGFRVGGTWSGGRRVQAPAIELDAAQSFTDVQVNAGFDSRPLTVEAGYVSNDGWRPQAYPEFPTIASLTPLPRTEWLTAHVRVAPVRFLTFESVYFNPVKGGAPEGSPPQHMISTATIRSRFLRNFPSGIFDLKLQAVLENWGAGVGGRDSLGTAVPLPAATFFRGIVQMQIGPFIVFYDKVNLQATPTGYVPRYPIIRAGGIFGVRWEFSN